MDDETTPLPDPRDFLAKQPKKGILKATSSFDKERRASPPREAHFDEMNIMQTYHPPDKDYGHIKIDEPKTPYHNYSDSEGEEGTSEGVRRVSISEPVCIEFDPNELKARLLKTCDDDAPKASMSDNESGGEEETEEEKEKRRQFEMKRKKHYNEFQAVKLAKQLIEQDEKEIAQNVDNQDSASKEPASPNRQQHLAESSESSSL